MRRWLLVLMIALLPIRGWVGDAMAGEMIVQHLATVGQPVAAAPASQATGPASQPMALPGHDGCAGHASTAQAASPAAGDVAPTEAHASADCSTCAACQVCHSVVIAPPGAATGISPLQHHVAALPDMRFASAEPARGFKPPIS